MDARSVRPTAGDLESAEIQTREWLSQFRETSRSLSVIMDSAMGLLGAAPNNKNDFLGHVKWLHEYLSAVPAPKFPFPVDNPKAAQGKALFEANCAQCHASARTGTRIPVAEVGTDRNRLETWNKQAAVAANKVVREMGLERKGLGKSRLTATRASSTAYGCVRRICTTARFRRCATCSSRSSSGRKFFIAATISRIGEGGLRNQGADAERVGTNTRSPTKATATRAMSTASRDAGREGPAGRVSERRSRVPNGRCR